MKRIILLSTLAIILSSCQSLRLANFESDYRLEQKLPPLEVDFDVLSFAPDYDDIYNIPNVILGGGINVENTVRNVTTELTISHDTKYIFEKEMRTNVSQSTGDLAGYAVCRKGMRSNGIKTVLHPLVSIFTLGVANLFGMPAAFYKDELEIMVEIYDNSNSLVGVYSGLGYGEAKQALYSGYTNRDAKRAAHAQAFIDAMTEVKEQIKEDSAILTEKLAG